MPADYLVRFDDFCPTMNWDMWSEIEQILDQNHIKPIIAVIPDNQDTALHIAPARSNFWERVRAWQRAGWTIGWHGYQHLYATSNSGLVGLNNRSEFAGLSQAEQANRLQAGRSIFQREGVRPDVWIAPAHSFDSVTLNLIKAWGVQTVSDGFFWYPRRDSQGMLWIPQQFWQFHRMPAGVWTICYHHNGWTEQELARFETDISRFADSIVSVDDLLHTYRPRAFSWRDAGIARIWTGLIHANRHIHAGLRTY